MLSYSNFDVIQNIYFLDEELSWLQAVHLIRTEDVNHEVLLRQLAPQEIFVQYGPEASACVFDLMTI